MVENHEIDTQARLLHSLFARSTLGLIKNMKECTCEVAEGDGSRSVISLGRRAQTGLLLIKLSACEAELPRRVLELQDPTLKSPSRTATSATRTLDSGTRMGPEEVPLLGTIN